MIKVFTDGSCVNLNKPNCRAGCGVYFGDKRDISYEIIRGKKTNQVAELKACILALHRIMETEKLDKKKIIIYSDSMYTINCVTKWAKGWEKNNWKKSTGEKIINKKLIKKLYYLTNNMNVEYKHVRAHKKEPKKNTEEHYFWYGNYMADKLATDATSS